MKKIHLQKMEIENFKGIRSFSIELGDNTHIVGDNSTGKTSLLDAYLWALTGMDSNGICNFKVQPLDEDNNFIPKVITRVSLMMSIDGVAHSILKEHSQNWSVSRSTKEEVFKGFSSKYLIDDVPYTERQYYCKLSELICDSVNFHLLSSITAFMDIDIKNKRSKLMEMAGEIEDISGSYPHIKEAFEKGKTIDEYTTQVSSSLRELIKREKEIPLRVSENEKNMPTKDFTQLKEREKEITLRISSIDSQLQKTAESRAELFSDREKKIAEVEQKQKEVDEIVSSLAAERSRIIENIISERGDIRDKVSELKRKKSDLEYYIESNSSKERALSDKVKTLGEQWHKVNSSQFENTSESVCPTCKRPFSEEEQKETLNALIKSFNEGKVASLKLISDQGLEIKKELDNIRVKLSEQMDELPGVKSELSFQEAKLEVEELKVKNAPSLELLKEVSKEYQSKLMELNNLKLLTYEVSQVDVDEKDAQLMEEKARLQSEQKSLIREIAEEDMIEKVKNRRKELEQEASDISTSIAEQQGILYEINEYRNRYIDLVNEKVSNLFSYVRFQMYEQNISNDGTKEKCECLVGGVPYSTNLNAGAKINAGIDIINALSKWLDIQVPLWIDNKERVSNLIDTDSQLITLSVLKDSPLKVM